MAEKKVTSEVSDDISIVGEETQTGGQPEAEAPAKDEQPESVTKTAPEEDYAVSETLAEDEQADDIPSEDDIAAEKAAKEASKATSGSIAKEAKKKAKAAKKTAIKPSSKDTKKKQTQENAMMALLERMNDRLDNMEQAQAEMLQRGNETKRRETILLSERERKQYAKEQMIAENIKLSGVSENFKTDADRDHDEVMLLNQATKSKTRLFGTVTEIGEANGTPTVRVYEEHDSLKHFPVAIPIREFFPIGDNDFTGPKGKEHLQNELVSRLGSRVEFMLYGLDEKNRIAGASRLNAMSDRAVMNYIKKREDGKPEFVPGMKTNARIIGVRHDKLVVDVHGVEAVIKNEDMGYNMFGRVQEKYQIGDEPLVMIKNIEPITIHGLQKDYPYVKLSVSIRDAQPDPAIEAFAKYHVKDIVTGRVIHASASGGVFVALNDIDCLCPYPKTRNGRVLTPGDEVPVIITRMDEEKHRISGVIYAYDR